MNKPKARPYQEKGINLLRRAYSEGKRKILFWLATGGGKSVVFLLLLLSMIERNKRIVFVVKRKQLVFQMAEHLKKRGIDCSIMIASHAGFDPSKRIQICSIDTVIRRDMEFIKDYDCVIVDEAHDTTSPSYQEFFRQCEEELNIHFFIGLTATPFEVNNKSHTFWDACVKPIEMHELRDQGFLVDADLFVPDSVDTQDVKKSRLTGDYNEKQLSKKMQKLEIIGDAIELYHKHANNRPALFFAVDKEHSMRQALEFQKAGITAIHVDESTKQKARDEALSALKQHARDNKPFVICNVNIFATGTDAPEAEVIYPKPTLSECLYLQQVGRVLRPCRICGKCKTQYDNSMSCPVCGFDRPEYVKTKAKILDMGNNTDRHGRAFDVRYPALDEALKEKGEKKERALIKTCKSCFLVYEAHLSACPSCGGGTTKERFHTTKSGELRPYDEYEMIKTSFTQLQKLTLEKNLKPNWKYFKLYESYGDIIMKYEKEFTIPKWVPKIYKKSQEEKLAGKLYK